MEAGLISAKQFEEGARSFAQLWEASSNAGQLWTWVASGNKLDVGYLQLEGIPRRPGARSEEHTCPAAPLRSPDDCDEALAWRPPGAHLYSFSIAYHPSYCVPVLLFQGRRPDGAPLSWEETLNDLPEASQATARHGDARWIFITLQEHPVMRVPMHCIHPCETAKLMSLLLAEDSAHASGEHSEAGRQQQEHAHQSLETWHIGTAELSEAARSKVERAGHCEQGGWRQNRLPPRSRELRYLCGWFSTVAPVVGLPLPLGLFGDCVQAGGEDKYSA